MLLMSRCDSRKRLESLVGNNNISLRSRSLLQMLLSPVPPAVASTHAQQQQQLATLIAPPLVRALIS